MNPGLRLSASASLVAAGFAAGVAQVILLRELLTVAYGNELSMGVLLACWLVWGAAGSLLARRHSRPEEPAEVVARRVVLLGTLPAALLAASVIIARSGPLVYSALLPRLCSAGGCPILGLLAALSLPPGQALDLGRMVLLGLVTAAGPAALDGAQFAIGCDLYARSARHCGGLGVAYALDAIGHLLGGVLLASAAVMAANPFLVAVGAGLVNLAAACAVARAGHAGGRPALYAVVAGLLLLAGASPHLHHHSVRWRIFHQEMLASVESIYGNLTITRQKPAGIYLYQSGVYSGASPPLPGTIDNFVHFAMLQHPAPRRVLMIGGGVMGGLAEVLRYQPAEVLYVELDAKLFEIARRWADARDLVALDDPRVIAVAGDGRRVVATHGHPSRWDVILVSIADPSTAQLNRFYTTEFYRAAAAALAPGGVIAWQMPGSEGYFGPALLQLHTCLLRTAQAVFPRIVALPGESTVCVAGTSDYLSDDWQVLSQRLQGRGITGTYLEAVLPEALLPWKLQHIAETLRSAPAWPQNRDLHPVGYFFDQAWWAEQFHPGAVRLFAALGRLTLWHLLVPALVIGLVLWALAPIRRVADSFVPLSVMLTGLISMALEVALLFAFQAIYGYVYHMVGVIVGAFMVGLAGGSLRISQWLQGRPARSARLAMVLTQSGLAALAGAVGVLLPALVALPGGWVESDLGALLIFPLLTALVGAAVGLQFPLAVASWYDQGETPHAAAGLYAADLVGASLGALVGGAVLAPVLGLPGTCYLAATLSAVTALLLSARVSSAPA